MGGAYLLEDRRENLLVGEGTRIDAHATKAQPVLIRTLALGGFGNKLAKRCLARSKRLPHV